MRAKPGALPLIHFFYSLKTRAGERPSPARNHKETPVCENICQPLFYFSYCL